MRPHTPHTIRRLPPALRVVVFVLMLWVLGVFPIFHSDADELARFTHAQVSAPAVAAQQAAPPVKPCPVCEWLARTPYTPSSVTPLLVAMPPVRVLLMSRARAPPRQVCRRIRNRAPPLLV